MAGPPFPSTSTLDFTVSANDPVTLTVRVYDLLPPSNFATVITTCGFGIHHTSVVINGIQPQLEFAYGGHDQDVSGVFVTGPYGSGGAMKLRFYRDVDMGECFGEDWITAFGSSSKVSKKRKRDGKEGSSSDGNGLNTLHAEANSTSNLIASSSSTSQQNFFRKDSSSTKSTTTLEDSDTAKYPHNQTGHDPTRNFSIDEDYEYDTDDWSKRRMSNLTITTSIRSLVTNTDDKYREEWQEDRPTRGPAAVKRALQVIEMMRNDERWRGNRYDLLHNNCNYFTADAVYALTGRQAPGWLNRAAWFGRSFPCLVPADWIEPPPPTGTTTAKQSQPSYDDASMRTEQMRIEMTTLSDRP